MAVAYKGLGTAIRNVHNHSTATTTHSTDNSAHKGVALSISNVFGLNDVADAASGTLSEGVSTWVLACMNLHRNPQ